MMYAVSGRSDEAFEWVAQAIKNKSSLLLIRFSDPLVDTLKKDDRYIRFQKLIYRTDVTSYLRKRNRCLKIKWLLTIRQNY